MPPVRSALRRRAGHVKRRATPVAVAIYVLASVALSLTGAFAGYHLVYAALA